MYNKRNKLFIDFMNKHENKIKIIFWSLVIFGLAMYFLGVK